MIDPILKSDTSIVPIYRAVQQSSSLTAGWCGTKGDGKKKREKKSQDGRYQSTLKHWPQTARIVEYTGNCARPLPTYHCGCCCFRLESFICRMSTSILYGSVWVGRETVMYCGAQDAYRVTPLEANTNTREMFNPKSV